MRGDPTLGINRSALLALLKAVPFNFSNVFYHRIHWRHSPSNSFITQASLVARHAVSESVALTKTKQTPNSGARGGGASLTPRRHAPPASPAPARTRICRDKDKFLHSVFSRFTNRLPQNMMSKIIESACKNPVRRLGLVTASVPENRGATNETSPYRAFFFGPS